MYRVEAQGSGFGGTRDAIHVLGRAAAECGKRRSVGARTMLYQAGEAAVNYFLVQSGIFGLYHPERGRRRPVCFMRSGDVFSFNCGDLHALSCQAVTDAVVLALERTSLARAAAEDPEIAALLKRLHADELSILLRVLPRPRPTRWSQSGLRSDAAKDAAATPRARELATVASIHRHSPPMIITGGLAA